MKGPSDGRTKGPTGTGTPIGTGPPDGRGAPIVTGTPIGADAPIVVDAPIGFDASIRTDDPIGAAIFAFRATLGYAWIVSAFLLKNY